jgi:hypothetical protein
MKSKKSINDSGCGYNRRQFIEVTGTATGGIIASPLLNLFSSEFEAPKLSIKKGAKVKTVFLYPPSKTFANDPNGWWSWPGIDYDAEGHQVQYSKELKRISSKLNMDISIKNKSVANNEDAQKILSELESEKPDGLLLIMFYNRSLRQADILLKAAEKLNIPSVFYIGLGVKHGSVRGYQRPGIYFIQAMDDFEAIESGMRMINTRKLLKQSVLLSFDYKEGRMESVEPFLGITVRPMLVDTYINEFNNMSIDKKADEFLKKITKEAIRLDKRLTEKAFKDATKAYFALKNLIEKENADAVAVNCLRIHEPRPCIAFTVLNNNLFPAICENDISAGYGQMIGQLLIGRPGFQGNPAYETEKNHYYHSHCTCPTKVYGPTGEEMKYLLRPYLHTNKNDRTAAIQVFYKPEDPITMIHYYSEENPKLDVYSGKVVKSHEIPPAAGCTTNVEIEITNREDANTVQGHHNLLFIGDFAKQFINFAHLHKLQLMKPLTNTTGITL